MPSLISNVPQQHPQQQQQQQWSSLFSSSSSLSKPETLKTINKKNVTAAAADRRIVGRR
jgi:hypothetical protein